LALSRLLRLRDQERSRASELAFITGLSAAEGIQSLASDLSVQLKWPNDVMIGDAKCGGCLVETSGSARAAMVAAIGIGVNIAHAPPIEGRKTTALAMHGSNPDPATLARSIIAAFETWLERWRGMGFEPVLRTWKAMAYGMGERLSVHIGQDTVTGRFEDIDGHGALLLKPDNAEMIRVQAGDVQAL
jgi:BirA family biotin operon repressor/biotin-[acetyl-CoA-carboxylase] ligase